MKKRHVLGLVETVTLANNNIKKRTKARIDTGAVSSSIDAALAKKLKLGPVIMKKTIKSALGKHIRPVVYVNLKVGNMSLKAQFTIANRTHMTYPVLIGQNVLKKGKFLIDPIK